MTKTKAQKRASKARVKIVRKIRNGTGSIPSKQIVVREVVKSAKPKKTFGAKLGSRLGSMIGHGAQTLFKHITGFGDYQVSGNSLMGKDVPIVQNSNGNAVILRHREYITDITSSQDFTLQSFAINPGLSETFPWLAGIASNFEEYRVRGLLFEFKTMASEFNPGANMALGTVVMATQYNVLFPDFPDKRTMENYEFANSAKPSQSFIHPIECAGNQTPVAHLYVRTGDVSIGDNRLYDLGNFQIATQGMSEDDVVIGELWATFEIEMYKPKLVQSLGITIPTDVFQLGGTFNSTNLLGSTVVANPGNSCGCTLNQATATLQFPKNCHGKYLVYLVYSVASCTANQASNTGMSIIQGGSGYNGVNIFPGTIGYARFIPNIAASATAGNAWSPGLAAGPNSLNILQVNIDVTGAHSNAPFSQPVGTAYPSGISVSSATLIVTQICDNIVPTF